MELFLFLDWLMELPKRLKREFRNKLDLYQQKKKMPYISSIEELAREDIAVSLLKEGVDIEITSEPEQTDYRCIPSAPCKTEQGCFKCRDLEFSS